jgi:pimeloyl-ACP methyl ester carboxylesterase
MPSPCLRLLLIAIAFITSAAFSATRTRQIIRYDSVATDVIIEGQGPAILLLPSLARDSEDYDAVAEGLAEAGFRVLRPQPRGIGASTGAMTGISLHDFANDIAEVITAIGNGRAVIVGHAYGNWVARMTAVDHPALVRSGRRQAISGGTHGRDQRRGRSVKAGR